MTPPKIKVCGMRFAENIRRIAELSPDMMGFIFYKKSPRFVGENPDKSIFDLPPCIEKVAVFVDEDFGYIFDICRRYNFSTVQLHGMETPDLCEELRLHNIRVIKAIGIKNLEDVSIARDYAQCADMLLFDTKTPNKGGAGEKFDWNILKGIPSNIPAIVSGGISLGDAQSVRNICKDNICGVDINSRFEISPALKDISAVSKFIKELRK